MAEPIDLLATILAEHGPLDEDTLEQRLRAEGVADAAAVIKNTLQFMECPAGQLTDERWVWVPTVVAGRVFTHRLSAGESTHDILTVTPDLAPLSVLFEHEPYSQLANGAPVALAIGDYDDELLELRGIPDDLVPEGGVLVLPPGTLDALGAGADDVVGIRISPQGLVVERVDATAPTDLGPRLAAMLAPDKPTYIDAAVWAMCLQDPAAFTEPAPPLSEIIGELGLKRQLELLAPAEFDFERWRFDIQCDALATHHDIDPDDALAVWSLVKLSESMSALLASADPEDVPEEIEPVDGPDVMAEFGAVLADPLLAEILLEETVGLGRVNPAGLGLFAETLEPRVPRAARVACRWLHALMLERVGAVEEAERELSAAESMDPDWPLALVDLARFSSDRGDAERSLALLRRAGFAADHPQVKLLEPFRAVARPGLGRNEPCWCGSGRKYKKCHLGNEKPPLAERAAWLYRKATQHVLMTGWSDLLTELEFGRARYDDDPQAAEDPLMMDIVLFEGGAFADFLRVRGFLLPDDERLLAEQWLLGERSVFEVEAVRPGQDVDLRDVRTGDAHTVRDRLATQQLKPGHLICSRLSPAEDALLFLGGLEPVALQQRDALVKLLDSEPDPEELVAFLSARFAPPRLANTEGHPMAVCEATARVDDPARLTAELDTAFDRLDGQRWHEHVTTQGMQRIRAIFTLEGNELRVETNSEQRMDDALATLARLDPTLSVVDDTREPIGDVRTLAERFPNAGEGRLDPQDPQVAAALDAFIRTYETTWLDESIPALNGYTPRQAAEDPTRRGDLIKLLNTFPAGAAAGSGMNADRLRAALGLE
ncbi:SEC-C domain-containing protein [[Mycobacterium] burgundiense]|uniref:SEC-C domain-containing protein n=1 Tax=[Mycobacterium] burgundiense TaxID=3064286 RepID=A0ABM9LLZ6_9MYCO|nr:SEC-C domain-containing protein [Mycolicibacterium sp. MU0053]CAJ1501327.1 SEC-C domain-containing protein [Mycolicibacterium sp. MU0053]